MINCDSWCREIPSFLANLPLKQPAHCSRDSLSANPAPCDVDGEVLWLQPRQRTEVRSYSNIAWDVCQDGITSLSFKVAGFGGLRMVLCSGFTVAWED